MYQLDILIRFRKRVLYSIPKGTVVKKEVCEQYWA